MSLCYDSEKWIIVSMASVTISLTVGLVLMAHGFVDGNNNGKDDVKETWDYLNMSATDWENQKERYDWCMHFQQLWNGSSCHPKEIK